MKLLVSTSAAGGFNTEEGFRLASELDVDGVEVLPFRKNLLTRAGSSSRLAELSREYCVPIEGIHLPFWWNTKSLRDVLRSEPVLKEKLFALLWQYVIGSGSPNCNALEVSKSFSGAYLLSHADAFRQMPLAEKLALSGKRVFFENERSKEGENNSLDGIVTDCMPKAKELEIQSNLMFDPRHYQLDAAANPRKNISLAKAWDSYRPAGLHFSFVGEEYLPGLPDSATWKEFAPALRDYAPKVIVLEVGPRDAKTKMRKARDMVGELFNL